MPARISSSLTCTTSSTLFRADAQAQLADRRRPSARPRWVRRRKAPASAASGGRPRRARRAQRAGRLGLDGNDPRSRRPGPSPAIATPDTQAATAGRDDDPAPGAGISAQISSTDRRLTGDHQRIVRTGASTTRPVSAARLCMRANALGPVGRPRGRPWRRSRASPRPSSRSPSAAPDTTTSTPASAQARAAAWAWLPADTVGRAARLPLLARQRRHAVDRAAQLG